MIVATGLIIWSVFQILDQSHVIKPEIKDSRKAPSLYTLHSYVAILVPAFPILILHTYVHALKIIRTYKLNQGGGSSQFRGLISQEEKFSMVKIESYVWAGTLKMRGTLAP